MLGSNKGLLFILHITHLIVVERFYLIYAKINFASSLLNK